MSVKGKEAKVIGKVKLIVCSILVIICFLFGCANQKEEEASFIAAVLEINQSSLLVEPAEGSAELNSADRIVAHVGDAIITDPQGAEVDITAVEVGDTVMIIYDGLIAESYPAQIWCFRVQLID